ncbi:hypothetical protein H8356DRAFT_1365100 [Neocallimastix lanati (nom. inval.)]|nr:hypothetical protein H8356DRAFT_1365100 [Neocallimastix sp. JGI-2020a]
MSLDVSTSPYGTFFGNENQNNDNPLINTNISYISFENMNRNNGILTIINNESPINLLLDFSEKLKFNIFNRNYYQGFWHFLETKCKINYNPENVRFFMEYANDFGIDIFSMKNNLEKCLFYFCKRGEFPDTKFDKETVYKDHQESIDSSHQRLNAVGGRKYYDNAAKPFLFYKGYYNYKEEDDDEELPRNQLKRKYDIKFHLPPTELIEFIIKTVVVVVERDKFFKYENLDFWSLSIPFLTTKLSIPKEFIDFTVTPIKCNEEKRAVDELNTLRSGSIAGKSSFGLLPNGNLVLCEVWSSGITTVPTNHSVKFFIRDNGHLYVTAKKYL